MAAKLSSTDVNEKIEDGNTVDSLTTALNAPITPANPVAGQTESSVENTICSEQTSNEDTVLSSAETSVNVYPTETRASVETNLHNNPRGGLTGAESICSPSSVEKKQPKPLCALLPSSTEACTVCEASQSVTTISRHQKNLKTTEVNSEPDGDDLCAAVLLACLFCHPLDCLLATMRGCNACIWSLCSSLCGCETSTLQPLLDITHRCDLCGCLGVRFLCDCPICDICLQATECLDLAMEISQMLYH